jgi:hypothetical protein
MATLLALLAAVLDEHSLTGVPTDTEIEQLTAEQRQELHQRLRDIVIEFRDRSRTEVNALRAHADDLQRQVAERGIAEQQQPATTLKRRRPPRASTLGAGPAGSPPERPPVASRNANLVRIPYPQSIDRRLIEIDREIIAITRRYKTIVSGWHT